MVLPPNHDGLSDELEDDSSDDITDDMKRKKRSRAALDDSFDHSDEDNPHQINPLLHRGLTNNLPAINANDKGRQRVTQSAGKNRSPPRKNRKTDDEDEYTNVRRMIGRASFITSLANVRYANSLINCTLPMH